MVDTEGALDKLNGYKFMECLMLLPNILRQIYMFWQEIFHQLRHFYMVRSDSLSKLSNFDLGTKVRFFIDAITFYLLSIFTENKLSHFRYIPGARDVFSIFEILIPGKMNDKDLNLSPFIVKVYFKDFTAKG